MHGQIINKIFIADATDTKTVTATLVYNSYSNKAPPR